MRQNRAIPFKDAKNLYVHRYTMEHIPNWAFSVRPDGSYYAPHYRNDQEWYENTDFPGENNTPKGADYCYSYNQTWPLGLTLTELFKKD